MLDIKFLGVTREDLLMFQTDAVLFGFTTTPVEVDGFDITHADRLYITDTFSKFDGKFVLTGISSSGKSTIINILNKLTGKKIMCLDLVMGIEKIKLCRRFGFSDANQLKENFCKIADILDRQDYTDWKRNICMQCIDKFTQSSNFS